MESGFTNKKINYLYDLIKHLEYYNRMAPFPVYDTGYVMDVKNLVKEMEENDKIDYDNLPTVACKYCKNLHILVDDLENDVCMRCGAVNDTIIFKNYNEYENYVNGEQE